MENMEYLFFDRTLAEKFMAQCRPHAESLFIQTEETPADGEAYSVVLEVIKGEEAVETVEQYYDELFFGEQAALIEGNGSEGALADACGVQIKLSSGEYTTVEVDPEIMNKLLSVLTVDELQQFLAQVAEDIEFPKSGPICQRQQRQQKG
ncbi:hypothetical protein [Galenea microaerophila]